MLKRTISILLRCFGREIRLIFIDLMSFPIPFLTLSNKTTLFYKDCHINARGSRKTVCKTTLQHTVYGLQWPVYNRNKSRLLFSSAEMFKKPLWQTVLTQIRLLLRAVCSGSTLFASILNLSVMLGNYLQQTTSADDIFRSIFFLAL